MFCRIVTKVNAYEHSFVTCVHNFKTLILGSMLQNIPVILLWYFLCIGCSDPYIYPTEKAGSLGLPPDSENIILKQLLLPGKTQRQLLCSGELVPLLSVICLCLLCMRMWFQRLLLLLMWLLPSIVLVYCCWLKIASLLRPRRCGREISSLFHCSHLMHCLGFIWRNRSFTSMGCHWWGPQWQGAMAFCLGLSGCNRELILSSLRFS